VKWLQCNDRGIPFMLALGVLGTAALFVTYAYSTLMFEDADRMARRREKTILDERIATAQEIKQALRKPIPGPEPLPPITAKPERAPSKVASAPEKATRRRTLSKEARDAFAGGRDAWISSQTTVIRDRHAVVSQ
jgi:hypothetical protein